jgi:hypothetical protein
VGCGGGPLSEEAKLGKVNRMTTHGYFAGTATAISPHKVDGMRGRPCLWGKEKGMGSEGGNDGVRSCEVCAWT